MPANNALLIIKAVLASSVLFLERALISVIKKGVKSLPFMWFNLAFSIDLFIQFSIKFFSIEYFFGTLLKIKTEELWFVSSISFKYLAISSTFVKFWSTAYIVSSYQKPGM